MRMQEIVEVNKLLSMAEHRSSRIPIFWVYSLFLSVLSLSSSCIGEEYAVYSLANSWRDPAASSGYLVSDIVSHSRVRRSADVTDLPNGTAAAAPALADNMAPTNQSVSGGDALNDTTSRDCTNSSALNVNGTDPCPTGSPLDDASVVEDDNDYYLVKSNIKNFEDYWVDLDKTMKHETLSKSHRVAAVIPLRFKFPFYGHLVNNVTVATGGFIYMSPFLHRWLTATQYIAPLMANFDLSISPKSNIYYLSLQDSFSVEWRDVQLQDQDETGNFSFQAILKASGEIAFVYKNIPLELANISKAKHPVKVGVSDAYYRDTIIPELNLKRRTIYEYHKVTVRETAVRSGAVVVIKPLPTCNILSNCTSCTEHKNVKFDCHWCNTIGRCSDGIDWYRQYWDLHGCRLTKTDDPNMCWPRRSTTTTTTPMPTITTTTPLSITSTTTSSLTTTTQTTPSSTRTTPTTTTPTTTTTTTTPSSTRTTPTTTTPTTTTTTTTPSSTRTTSTTTTPTTTTTTTTPTTSTPNTTPTTATPTTTTPTTTTTTTTPTTTTTTDTTTIITTTSTTITMTSTTTPATAATGETAGHMGTARTSSVLRYSFCGFINSTADCSGLPPPSVPIDDPNQIPIPLPNTDKTDKCANGKCGKGSDTPVAVIVILILLIAGLTTGIGGWVYYAYTHPTSKSGMWLMEHRPSQIKAKIQFWKGSSDTGAAKYKIETEA